MKAHLTLLFALLPICTGAGAALAQGTPDFMTPHQETICDSETGAAFGLCNAYCEAMDCDSANRQATETACTKVKTKFTNITGRPLPCETCPLPPPGTLCPCTNITDFNTLLNSSPFQCQEFGTVIAKFTNDGEVAATCTLNPPLGGGCGVQGLGVFQVLNITPEEGQACVQLIREHCGPV